MAPTIALLPSPLLGASAWAPVADRLSARDWETVICGAGGSIRTPQDALDGFLADLPAGRDLVLVPHSNAGAYVPALVMQRRVVGTVFVDAVLPPANGDMPLAPPGLLDLLRAKADAGGMLPAWTDWWAEEDVAELFPDASTRALVEQEQRKLPVSYFEESLPIPAGWDELPAAYLTFGDTYAGERRDAALRHWPVTTMAGAHLHQLRDPDRVTDEIVALFDRLGISAPAEP